MRKGDTKPETAGYLNTAGAAAYLGVSRRTLEGWRTHGGGPPYRKIGAKLIRYAIADLDAFAGEAFQSTAEERGAR